VRLDGPGRLSRRRRDPSEDRAVPTAHPRASLVRRADREGEGVPGGVSPTAVQPPLEALSPLAESGLGVGVSARRPVTWPRPPSREIAGLAAAPPPPGPSPQGGGEENLRREPCRADPLQ